MDQMDWKILKLILINKLIDILASQLEVEKLFLKSYLALTA
jgi:hypothetical protein